MSWLKLILQLICILSCPQSLRQTLYKVSHLPLSQVQQLSKLLPLGTSKSHSVYVFLELEPQLSKIEEFNNQGKKENRAFRSYSFFHQKTIKSRQALHEIFLKYQYNCAQMPQSSISTHLFSNNSRFLRISKPLGQNQQNGKQCLLINTLALQDQPQGYIPYFFMNSLGL